MNHKKIFSVFIIMIAMCMQSLAHDFSKMIPSGQTLYFNILNGNSVEVTYPTNFAYENGKPIGNIVLPDTINHMGVTFFVTSIGFYSFHECTELVSVELPNTVTNIDAYAFEGCTSLTNISFGDSVTSIGIHAFNGCRALSSITLPSLLTSIGEQTFCGCSGLTSIVIPDNVHYIYSMAFFGCSNLSSIEIGNGITYIYSLAFGGCTSLTYINIPNSVVSIAFGAFQSCNNLSSVKIGSGVSSYGNNTTYDDPFYGCTNIENLEYDCPANILHTFPKTKLKRVTIGNNVTSIAAGTLQNADSLRIVTIGNSVTSIGDNAFRFCAMLDTIYALPQVAPALGENVFQATNTNKVVVTTCNADYASVWGNDGFTYITGGFILTLSSNNNTWGSASFLQGVNCQQIAIIKATATPGHRFTSWSDGNTENPRTISLFHDSILTAIFEEYNVTVIAESANEIMGNVSGSGNYSADSEVELIATANCNYRFSHWHDGNIMNPRTLIVNTDTTLIAYFTLNIDTVIMYDTIYIPIHDTAYITLTDTIIDTIHDTMIVTDTVVFNNFIHDTTILVDTLRLTDTIYIIDTLYITDTVYVGVDDVTITNVKIYVQDGEIVVENVDGYTVSLYDTLGRIINSIKQSDSQTVHIPVPTSGTFLVKVGDFPPRKIVVIR